MILADKIIELRKKNGWSQEELAEMLDVSRQSVSKWEGAQSIPDMNRIIRMSEVFGVSTDFLLKDELDMPAERELSVDTPDVRTVSMEEANSFLQYNLSAAKRIAAGVMMCILSPVILILLSVSVEEGRISFNEDRTAAIGLIVMFLLIAGAVALFVISWIRGSQYEYLEKELIETTYGVDGMARERWEQYKNSFSTMLVTGIVLCVLSAVPIFIGLAVYGDNDFVAGIGTAILLVIVSAGVYLIVRSCIIKGGFDKLLQRGDYTVEQKLENKRNATLTTVYWAACTAGYLAASFITNQWHRTWIIWPVAGVCYALVTAVAKALRERT